MPLPFLPSEFCQLTPTASTEPCEAMKRIFFEQPSLLCDMLNYLFDENGNVQDEFKKEVSQLPIGTVLDHAGITVPAGYLLCDGREVSRSTYADLFAVIGTVYGAGDGSTTFNLPDTRGRVTVGVDSTDADFVHAATGGEKEHTLTVAEMPSHDHSITFASSTSGGGQPTAAGNGNNSGFGSFTVTSAGGGAAHNNMPPYAAFQKIIKY